MTTSPSPEGIATSEIPAPPFARTPDPAALFEARAARFRALAEGHALAPYLAFLAGLTEAQARVAAALPAAEPPPADAVARAREFGMPPLDRGSFAEDEDCAETLRRFLAEAASVTMPAPAQAALARVSGLDGDGLAGVARAVLDDAIPAEAVAEHVLVAAGVQVHAARAAAALDASRLVAVGDGVCPACGGAPTASLLVGWDGAHGARYCACSLCGTLWNYVRVRCVACGSTKGISYQELDGEGRDPKTGGVIKAECCQECRSFVKLMRQLDEPAVDPVADDVASSGLDRLVAETGMRRAGVNPYLLGL